MQSDETRLHLHDAHRRVMSVAAVQKHLQATGHGEQFPIAPYLSRLCETLAASMIGEERHVRIQVNAGAADVSSTEAVSIGLIVTELVINALKHAFGQPSATGVIVVSYEVARASWQLTVSDDGVGASRERRSEGDRGPGDEYRRGARQATRRACRDLQNNPPWHDGVDHPGAFPTRLSDAA